MLFDNVEDWKSWKIDLLDFYKMLEYKYGKEFRDWAIKNRNKIPKKFLDAGCKTLKEYKDRCAKNAGFKDSAERLKEWTHEIGRCLPKEFNEYCSIHFGEFTESLMIQTFEDPTRMPFNNPGFDWKCNMDIG